MIAAELSRRLRLARLNANIAQSELADRSGLSLRTVIRAESGESGTTLLTLIAMLRALGKLASLDLFLPEAPLSPLEVHERAARPRQRASKPRKEANAEDEGGWKWGDET